MFIVVKGVPTTYKLLLSHATENYKNHSLHQRLPIPVMIKSFAGQYPALPALPPSCLFGGSKTVWELLYYTNADKHLLTLQACRFASNKENVLRSVTLALLFF